MILDALLQFSGSVNAAGTSPAGQLITNLGNTLSTNVIDLASVPKPQNADIGIGSALEMFVSVLQSLTSAGAATVQFQLVQADDAAITSNVQVLNQTDAIPIAALVAGAQIPLHYDRATPFPPRRYVAVRYVVGTAALTNATGQFYTSLVKSVQDPNTLFKGGFSVQ